MTPLLCPLKDITCQWMGSAPSLSAKSLPSVASPCSQANERLDAPPAVATGATSVMTEPAEITACPSGLPRHRENIQDNNNVAEGDCPSSCPPAEQAEAGAPGAQALKGMRRRWQQASLARTGAPSEGGEPRELDTSQQQVERERPATTTETCRGTPKAAATKHSAVKSKAVKPLAVLQCMALKKIPTHRTRIREERAQACKSALLRLP